MPNIDGGHYFLTVLAPIKLSNEIAPDGSIDCPSNRLRKLLALMPTTGGGREGLVGEDLVLDRPRDISPFARNDLNHFVRFAVIEDVNYNGRINGDGLVEALRGINPAELQAVDHLSRPYLLFAAEFDPNREGAPEPDVYLDRLWTTMEIELRDIFKYCFHFDEVKTAGDFVRYIKRCEIETTMPFNDYWIEPPPFKTVPLKAIGYGALGAGILAATGTWFGLHHLIGWFGALLLAIIIAVALPILIIRFAIRSGGDRPFPTAPDSDLRTILKALYLQRAFVDFAISNQGAPAEALSDAFEKFIARHRPGGDEPTQSPGVVGA
jgi:hypothetical protein